MKVHCLECNKEFETNQKRIDSGLRETFKYRQWRSDVFSRDNWTCQTCGVRGVYLEAHHLYQFSYLLSDFKINNVEEAVLCNELWDISNGVTLCHSCHNLTKHGKGRR